MKMAAAVALCVVFVFSYGGAQTSVKSPETSLTPAVVAVTTTQPFLETLPPATTTPAPTTTTTTAAPRIEVASPTTALPDIVLASLPTVPVSNIERIICNPRYEWDCKEALAVAWCESWHHPRSVSQPNRNGTIDRGLFQINDVWEDAFSKSRWAAILDAETNTAMAYHIWKSSGESWEHWRCQP